MLALLGLDFLLPTPPLLRSPGSAAAAAHSAASSGARSAALPAEALALLLLPLRCLHARRCSVLPPLRLRLRPTPLPLPPPAASSSSAGPAAASPSASALAEKEAQIVALEAKQKETYDRLLRTAADLENVRRTSRLDVENARKYAATGFAKSMLDVADTLQLAANSAREQAAAAASSGSGSGSTPAAVQSLLEGVEMTEKCAG